MGSSRTYKDLKYTKKLMQLIFIRTNEFLEAALK